MYFIKRFKKLVQNDKYTYRYSCYEMRRLHKKLFNNTSLMTGTKLLIIFTLLKIHNDVELNYIGFSNHELVNNTQTYYYGERKLENEKDIKRHTKIHDFNLQYLLLDLINYF